MSKVNSVPGLAIIFDGPPSHESGRFVEVEIDGKGGRVGEWVEREDGLWALVLGPVYSEASAAHLILWEINEFFRHNNPVDPSAMFNDTTTFKNVVAEYMAKSKV